jgi:hypothetical protein
MPRFWWKVEPAHTILQPVQLLGSPSGATMGQNGRQRILAEEAAQEKNPEKLMEIIASLTRALDERAAKKNGNGNGQSAA